MIVSIRVDRDLEREYAALPWARHSLEWTGTIRCSGDADSDVLSLRATSDGSTLVAACAGIDVVDVATNTLRSVLREPAVSCLALHGDNLVLAGSHAKVRLSVNFQSVFTQFV
jgi:hypothetical protein